MFFLPILSPRPRPTASLTPRSQNHTPLVGFGAQRPVGDRFELQLPPKVLEAAQAVGQLSVLKPPRLTWPWISRASEASVVRVGKHQYLSCYHGLQKSKGLFSIAFKPGSKTPNAKLVKFEHDYDLALFEVDKEAPAVPGQPKKASVPSPLTPEDDQRPILPLAQSVDLNEQLYIIGFHGKHGLTIFSAKNKQEDPFMRFEGTFGQHARRLYMEGGCLPNHSLNSMSGGAVVNQNGELVGVFTSSDEIMHHTGIHPVTIRFFVGDRLTSNLPPPN